MQRFDRGTYLPLLFKFILSQRLSNSDYDMNTRCLTRLPSSLLLNVQFYPNVPDRMICCQESPLFTIDSPVCL